MASLLLPRLKPIGHAIVGRAGVAVFDLVRRSNLSRLAKLAGRTLRTLGPRMPEHRVGRANLAAAYPGISADDTEKVLAEVWDNIGRVGIEYAHLDRLWDFDPARPGAGRVEMSAETQLRWAAIRHSGKPGLFFTAHLGNWELCAIACKAMGVETEVLYRSPNVRRLADALLEMRRLSMGPLIPAGFHAAGQMMAAIQRGAHVGILIDQHFSRGIDVTFFGRPCKASPLLARLAQRYECPIYGIRVVRLPHERFRIELTDALEPARNETGKIDVGGTMQRATDVIETWVRENPGQWLWLHRRWR